MAYARLTLFVLGTAGALLGCGTSNLRVGDPARVVVASSPTPVCSVQITRTGGQEELPDVRRARLVDYVDAVAAALPSVQVTYFDFAHGRSLTLTIQQPCNVGAPFAELEAVSASRGFAVGELFQPHVIVPTAAEGVGYLEHVIQQTSELPQTLEGCSMSIPLSMSSSAEDERDFYAVVGQARDRYGVPLLFLAQAEHTMYITFYRQCSFRRELYQALTAVLARHYRGSIRMNGYARVERAVLRRAYALDE